jgi:UDP-N-acetylmuramate-alanine ligase
MLNNFQKFIFSLKKPKIIIVAGDGRILTSETIYQVLKQHFKVKRIKDGLNLLNLLRNKVFIFESEIKEIEPFEFLVRKSKLPILVVTALGETPFEGESFTADPEKIKEIARLAEVFPSSGYLVLNSDDGAAKELGNKSSAESLTFGFQEKADFRATDVKIDGGTNFKINYKMNIVPIWLEKFFGKEQIYSALAVAGVGEVLKLNLVKVSESLKGN